MLTTVSTVYQYRYTLWRRRNSRAARESQYNHVPLRDHIGELEQYHTVYSLPHCGNKTKLSLYHNCGHKPKLSLYHTVFTRHLYHTVVTRQNYLFTTLGSQDEVISYHTVVTRQRYLIVLNNATHCGCLHADSQTMTYHRRFSLDNFLDKVCNWENCNCCSNYCVTMETVHIIVKREWRRIIGYIL